MQRTPLSTDQMVSVLDNAPMAVYVSGLDNCELLYANSAARALFLQEPEAAGGTCYQAAGFQKPCSFCPVGELDNARLWVREFFHPGNHRCYQLSGKIIDWGGRPAHIEYILDITEKKKEEDQFRILREELQETFKSVPCGLCVYRFDGKKIMPVFHNPAFYEIMGYSKEHIRKIEEETDYLGVHPDDIGLLQEKTQDALQHDAALHHIYRLWNDRKNTYVWISLDGAVKVREDGVKLIYAVYSDISEQRMLQEELKETKQEMDHLINSIPGGIASYRVEGEQFIPTFYSDGVMSLSGHTRKEYDEMVGFNALDIIYGPDRERVLAAVRKALENGTVLDVSYRMYHKLGHLIWIHLSGQRMGPLADTMKFYAVFTGMSSETRLFQDIADDTSDGIYVIDKANYEILYRSETKDLFTRGKNCLGKKCYTALHGRDEPCSYCVLKYCKHDGESREMVVPDTKKVYSTRYRETDWNGIPAYVIYVRDVTEEVNTRKEKERLAAYFQSVVENIPGGISVIRCEADGSMVTEYISDGFAAMTRMTLEETKGIYKNDFFAGVHPEDREHTREKLLAYLKKGEGHCEFTVRMQSGEETYIWVKCTLSLLKSPDGIRRIYSVYTDVTQAVREQEEIRRQYKDLILRHYRTPGPNALIVGHCNITQNKIIEILDYTDSGLLEAFGDVRDGFFIGLSSLIVDKEEREAFLNVYLNEPALTAYEKNETEQTLTCFVKLPKEKDGRYVQFKVILVETPDTGDITGILTVTDVTEQTISDRIFRQLSVASCDLVLDVDLLKDQYRVLACDESVDDLFSNEGSHSQRIAYMVQSKAVPKDRKQIARMLDRDYMRDRLEKDDAYSFSYAIIGGKGETRTKNLTVSPIDSRLGRVCLARADITESVREQQGLLNMIAYTFELAGFIDVGSKRFTMYTRQTILENLPPYIVESYNKAVEGFTRDYGLESETENVHKQFYLETILSRLGEKPEGYDFVFAHRMEQEIRYKQINVLWGDKDHRTICIVRADVTEMLASERKTKQSLEKALLLAEEANRAKSDFLSAMSHDIRTPMNAIMGMTELAVIHIDDRSRVADCLQKISISSKHLLSLINDILDMSKIENSKITLNHMAIFLPDLLEQIAVIMEPQAKAAGLEFYMGSQGVRHEYFYGDALRINQILINILSNAVKFTPEGGRVDFLVKEAAADSAGKARYCFIVSDTGLGMEQEFLDHVFDSFMRSRSVTGIEGTGLGLSITKGLVDLMGGRITVESKVGTGSSFYVELECEIMEGQAAAREHQEKERAESANGKLFAGRRFLIAEDNAINAEILCEILSMYGAQSVVKTDGEQAAEEFRKSKPGTYDAVLMDIQMPKMNGYEATRAIRGILRTDAKNIPIIAMTANAFAEDVQAAADAGMTAHVAKPIDFKMLQNVLNKVLERKDR